MIYPNTHINNLTNEELHNILRSDGFNPSIVDKFEQLDKDNTESKIDLLNDPEHLPESDQSGEDATDVLNDCRTFG